MESISIFGFNSFILPLIISKIEYNENPHAIPKEMEFVKIIMDIVMNIDVPITGSDSLTCSS